MGKKKIVFIVTTLLIIGIPVIIGIQQKRTVDNKATQVSNKSEKHVLVELDNGSTIATYSAVSATAYGALESVTKEKGIVLEVKQYDFGIFVQKIGDKVSSADMSWIYFVNGQSGTVAADKTVLNDNDLVSWRYIKPSM